MRKRRIGIVILCTIVCVVLVGVVGCAPSKDEDEPAQEPEAAVVEGQEQEAVETSEAEGQEQEAVETSEAEGLEAQDPFTGTWVLYEMTVDGETISSEQLAEAGMEDDYSIVLADDGSASFRVFTESIEGTWEASSDTTMTFTSDGDSITFTLEGGKLYFNDDSNEYVFERSEGTGTDASGVSSSSDFTVKDLKIDEGEDRTEKLEDQYSGFGDTFGDISDNRYQYIVTGTLVNNGDKDAGQVVIDLLVTEKVTDEYGEEVTTSTSEDIASMTSGVFNNTFYDMKAGEEREFSFAFTSGAICTDPIMRVVDVIPEIDPHDSEVLFGDDEFDVEFGAESDSNGNLSNTIVSTANTLIDKCELHYAYTDSSGTWYEDETAIDRIWPGETYEISDESFATFYDEHPENLTFLGMTYVLDKETSVSSFRDEFDIDIDEDAHVIKLTNNTGHYLKRVTLEGKATQSDGRRMYFEEYAEYIAPGDTAEIDLTGDDCNVYDVTYEIDESKE